MTQSQITPTDLLRERIQDDIDSSIVVTDASEVPSTAPMSTRRAPTGFVIKPAEVQQVPSIVKIATSMGFAITQRGGACPTRGLSAHAGQYRHARPQRAQPNHLHQ
ncbi:MAG: hypothetical protein CM15mP74_06150 [Halieaceae bacterium]|nr:MAG: hypothetical protein CM15mP74_06150 [Halieaceae bacterium]